MLLKQIEFIYFKHHGNMKVLNINLFKWISICQTFISTLVLQKSSKIVLLTHTPSATIIYICYVMYIYIYINMYCLI